ncbi:hypothetical protein IH779_00695 [Patescibacteria group bacterium]|nr:hypothetical protein [Patescibacteria group bacterium]
MKEAKTVSGEKTLHSFGELKEVRASFISLPELPEISDALTADEAVAERIREGAEQIREWVTTVLPKIDETKSGSREAQELAVEAIKEVEKTLREYIQSETPAYRRASWLGVLSHRFSAELGSRTEAIALLQELVEQGYLQEIPVPNRNGDEQETPQELPATALKAYGKDYVVPAESAFGEPETNELEEIVAKFLSRVWETEKKVRTETAQDFFTQSELTAKEFRAGKPGKFALGIPPEEVKLAGGATDFWRGGGTLLMESDGEKVMPLAATGSIQKAITEAKDLGVHLKAESLQWETPPFVRTLPSEMNRKIQLIWHLIQRGLRALEEKQQRQALKEELAKKATISSEQFLLKEQKGTCLVQLEQDWEERAPDGQVVNRVLDPFFLVERFTQDEKDQPFILLVEVPPHFEELLKPCMGEHPEGDKFFGVPHPLGTILRNAYGQATKLAQINDQT